MALPGKRCQYEVLGLGRDCTADEISSAYHRLALQRHTDRLAHSDTVQLVNQKRGSYYEFCVIYQFLRFRYEGQNGASFDGPIEMHLDELQAVNQSHHGFETHMDRRRDLTGNRVSGGIKVCVRVKDYSENGTVGALYSQVEDESGHPTFILGSYCKEAWIEDPPTLEVFVEV
ncbi:hypothetical protein RJ639_029296 [Escallonia herrerae]|uniref:J domain-containing protein n=1 Tax=Escallonia herrerae TaxID=1293975 RepID=A0AA88X468_9ASTE|nr:hypothetical protein RJ639_029296 [Escallonia herrerae]